MRSHRSGERRVFDSAGCLTPGGGATGGGEYGAAAGLARAAELRRQARLVDDLLQRVATVVHDLPDDMALADWWGPARESFHGAVTSERGQLSRAVYRLDGVRLQLEHAALLVESGQP